MSGILKTLYTPKPSTWTFNAWVKRSQVHGNAAGINNSYIFGASDHISSTNGQGLGIMTSSGTGADNDELGFYSTLLSPNWTQVSALNNKVLRDFDGWYNIHIQCSSNVADVYVNGVQTHNNLSFNISSATTLNIGNLGWVMDSNTYSLNGQMQEAHFVDGQELSYTVFVETSASTNGSLIPKSPSGIKADVVSTGGYGTNGYYWDFSTPQTSGLLFKDLAGKQWQPVADSVSGVFNTGFVRTGSSARTVNNSSMFFPSDKWTTATEAALIMFEGDVFNPGSVDLTIEMWIYPLQDTQGYIFDTRYSSFTSNPALYINNANTLDFYLNSSTVISQSVSGGVADGNWHHVAMTYVESTSTWTLYWDGTALGSAVSDWSQQSSKVVLGTRYTLVKTYSNEMFMEGFRYTGQLLYNGSFTPGPIDSTEQYTTDGGSNYSSITGTVHSCLNSDCKDASYNKGSSPQYQLRPFVGGTRYASTIQNSGMCGESKYGKSSYYLRSCTASTNYGSAWDLSGDIDFTFETWIKFNAAPVLSRGYISIEQGDGTSYASYEDLLLFGGQSGTLDVYSTLSTSLSWSGHGGQEIATPVVGQWHHFAYCRSSSDNLTRVYWDGVQQRTNDSGAGGLYQFTNPALLLNGRWNTGGYTSNTDVSFDGIRLIRGQNIYPSGTTFTPGPTSNTTQYTLNGGTTYSSITGTVPFCLDDQRSTITEDKSSASPTGNGGIFIHKTVETEYNQQNVFPQPSTVYEDSSRNKFLKFNPTMGSKHGGSALSTTTAGGLGIAPGSFVSNYSTVYGNFGVTTGKYYFEFKSYNAAGANNVFEVFMSPLGRYRNDGPQYTRPGTYGVKIDSYTSGTNGVKVWWNENTLGSDIAHTSQTSGGDIYGIAWDVVNHRVYIHQNGVWLGSANPEALTGYNINVGSIDPLNPSNNTYMGSEFWGSWYSSHTESTAMYGNPNLGWTIGTTVATSSDNTDKSGVLFNFGQGTTGDNYSDANSKGKFRFKPPTGFISLCTSNRESNENLGTVAKNPDAYMGVIEYTADGTTQPITGLGFKPDLLIGLQQNDSTGYYTGVMDSVRGFGRLWTPQSPLLANCDHQKTAQITSFDADGFTVGNNSDNGNYLSLSGRTYTAYCWKAGGPIGTGADKYKRNGSTFVPEASSMTINGLTCNTDSGFSIVNYTGDTGVYRYIATNNTVMSISNSADNLSLGTGDWTVEFWFYVSDVTATGEMINKGHPLQFYQTGSDMKLYMSSDGTNYDIAAGLSLTNSRPFTNNRWHHIVLQRDDTAGTYTAWYNGRRSLVVNSTLDLAETSAEWKIGAYNNSTGSSSCNYFWSGYLCDFNVWRGVKQYSNEIIDIVKPTWTNGGSATTISDFQKSTTNLLMSVNTRNASSTYFVSGISGLSGYFSTTGTAASFSTAFATPGFIPHGLTGRPSLGLVKSTTNTGSANAYPIYIAQGLTDYIPVLGETHFCVNGYTDNFYLDTASSVSTYNLDSQVNDENRNYTVYLWQEIPGYSSMGVYWGMPNDVSSAINVGFQSKYVQLHHVVGTNTGHETHVFDTVTSTPNNGTYNSTMFLTLVGNSQPSGTNNFHITSSGWETIDADAEPYIAGTNTSSKIFYMAFAEQPFAYANGR